MGPPHRILRTAWQRAGASIRRPSDSSWRRPAPWPGHRRWRRWLRRLEPHTLQQPARRVGSGSARVRRHWLICQPPDDGGPGLCIAQQAATAPKPLLCGRLTRRWKQWVSPRTLLIRRQAAAAPARPLTSPQVGQRQALQRWHHRAACQQRRKQGGGVAALEEPGRLGVYGPHPYVQVEPQL